MKYTLTISIPHGGDLDIAIAALIASDLGGNTLETITITPAGTP